MNRLSLEKRCQIIHLLVEGMSLRAITRVTGVAINTVTKVLVETATAASEYQDEVFRNLKCKRLELDEIWAFTYCKQKNINKVKCTAEQNGDTWTWTALDPDSRLIVSWYVGGRDATSAALFIQDLAQRLQGRVRLSSDGYKPYLQAIDDSFGLDVDYGQLVKIYGTNGRYMGANREIITGKPDKISTSLVERQNLTMRTHMRRFVRRSNGFSKKIENHALAVSLHFMYYNFCKIHKTLRCTPAMEAGISSKLWEIEDIAALVKEEEVKPRGAYINTKLSRSLFSN